MSYHTFNIGSTNLIGTPSGCWDVIRDMFLSVAIESSVELFLVSDISRFLFLLGVIILLTPI